MHNTRAVSSHRQGKNFSVAFLRPLKTTESRKKWPPFPEVFIEGNPPIVRPDMSWQSGFQGRLKSYRNIIYQPVYSVYQGRACCQRNVFTSPYRFPAFQQNIQKIFPLFRKVPICMRLDVQSFPKSDFLRIHYAPYMKGKHRFIIRNFLIINLCIRPVLTPPPCSKLSPTHDVNRQIYLQTAIIYYMVLRVHDRGQKTTCYSSQDFL